MSPGSTCGPRGHHSSRSYARECNYIHRRFGMYVCRTHYCSARSLTSSNMCTGLEQDRPHLEAEIRKAHVICVVYAIDNPHTFDRIPTYWLPYFRQLGVNVSLRSLHRVHIPVLQFRMRSRLATIGELSIVIGSRNIGGKQDRS